MKTASKKRSDDVCLPSISTVKKDFASIEGFELLRANIFDCMAKLSTENDLEKRASLLNYLINYTNELSDGLHDRLINEPNNNVIATAIVKNTKLQAIAAEMLKSITNTWTNAQLKTMQDQSQEQPEWDKKHKTLWHETYKNHGEQLRWGMMEDKLEFDKEFKVTRLTKEERENYRVFLDNGAVKEFVLVGKGEDSQLVLRNFDTKDMTSGDKPKSCIFIVSREGNIYASNTVLAKFHHSSLGDDLNKGVSFAGSMKVYQGKIKYIDNSSGHYQPSADAVRVLGIMLSKADVIDESTRLFAVGTDYNEYPIAPEKRQDVNKEMPYHVILDKDSYKKECIAFTVKFKRIKNIEFAVDDFHQKKHLRSPSENMDALDKIETAINEQLSVNPDEKRVAAMGELKEQIHEARDYFKSLLDEGNFTY